MRPDLIIFNDRLQIFLDEIKEEKDPRKILWNYRHLLEEGYPIIEQQQKILNQLNAPDKLYGLSVCRLINLMYYERSGSSTRFMTHERASLTRRVIERELKRSRSKFFAPKEETDEELFQPFEPVDIQTKRAARYFSMKHYDPSVKERIDLDRISEHKTIKNIKAYKDLYTADQMRGFCQQLGLSHEGSKEDLAYRLLEHLEEDE